VHRFLKKQSSILIILAVLGSVFLSISIPSIYLAKIEIWPAFGKTQNYIPLIDEHREAIWHKSIQLFKKAPITGYGAKHANQIEPADVYFRSTGISLFRKNFSEKELIDIKNLSYVKPYEYMPIHPHHVIFELMLELGWFGFLAFIIMISIWSAKITQMPLIEKTYGMSLFFTIFMVWLFTHSFWSSWFHIFIAGLIFLLINTPLKNRIT
ncbi:MAG: O-antigen ligase family protein, partial [Pseudomonadota bacterium]